MTRTGAIVGLALVATAVAVGVIGCGGGQVSHRRGRAPFAWLRPAPPPADWHVARLHGGSTLAYPPAWKPIKTDPGTASVALLGAGGRFDGYLNATPRQGSETLANWSRFRPRHIRDEGSRNVRLAAAADHLSFRTGRGSCVIDSYATSKAAYREVACLVAGADSSAVVVGAAPARLWAAQMSTLHRAVSSFVP
jgi:hypothetical protein